MSLVWWMFYQSDMTSHLADGLNSGWPHENYDWYKSRGMVDYNPRVGDIAFFWYYNFAGVEGVSCSHAGLVVDVSGDSVLVIDALGRGIYPRWYSIGSIVGLHILGTEGAISKRGARACEILFLVSGFLVSYNHHGKSEDFSWKRSITYTKGKFIQM